MQILKEGKLKYFLIFLAYLFAFINYIFIVKAIYSSAELTSFNIFLSSIKSLFKESSTDSLKLAFLINIIAVISVVIFLFILVVFKKAKSFGISNQQLAKLKIYQDKGFYINKKKPFRYFLWLISCWSISLFEAFYFWNHQYFNLPAIYFLGDNYRLFWQFKRKLFCYCQIC